MSQQRAKSVPPDAPLDPSARAQMKRWLDTWKVAGPILERERWDRVKSLTDDQAWNEAQDLYLLWEPWMEGDAGEALLLHQSVFRRVILPRSQ